MKSVFRLSVLILSAVVTLPVGATQLYKWTDANGRVQYTDTPPPNVKAEALKNAGGGTSSASGSAAPQSAADQEQAFRKRRAEAEEANQKLAKDESEKKQREEECKRSRGYLTRLEQGGRIAQTDEKGEREYFDDAKLEAEKERVRKQLSEFCK